MAAPNSYAGNNRKCRIEIYAGIILIEQIYIMLHYKPTINYLKYKILTINSLISLIIKVKSAAAKFIMSSRPM